MNLTNQQWQSLYRYGVTLCGDNDEALDLLHAAVERLLRVKHTKVITPEAYLRTVMRNLQYDRWRQQKNTPVHVTWEQGGEDLVDVISLDTDDLENTIIRRDTLLAIWKTLSIEQKDILYLWAWLGYSTQEAADELNMPKGSLLAKIHRLRQKLIAENNSSESARAAP
ncbi:hypothetical protein R50072_10660 [Simiduia litorea]|uniref:RNA polymerase sigma factor n=1 Tax=Simiduia litorea TaxID=1435348 RepID=UPI0036F2B760